MTKMEDAIKESKWRGRKIIWFKDKWTYEDGTDVSVDDPCFLCKNPMTVEGHDPCLGTLPNVMNACCGHGIEGDAYVQFWDDSRIDGKEAVAFQEKNKSVKQKWSREMKKDPILRFFEYKHLPQHLQVISKPFGDLAHQMANDLPESPEVAVCLRKLLEAKDCAVRANLPARKNDD